MSYYMGNYKFMIELIDLSFAELFANHVEQHSKLTKPLSPIRQLTTSRAHLPSINPFTDLLLCFPTDNNVNKVCKCGYI